MATLSDLHAAVERVIASKRLGTPLFVRYTATGEAPQHAAVGKLAGLADVVRRWLGQGLDQVYALGGADGSLTLALDFQEGATALVCLVPHLPGGGIDLMLLGNRGAIYHDAADADSDARDAHAAP